MKLEELNPADLKPNPWNTNTVSPQNEEKLEGSIERLGMFKPLVLRTLPDGTLQILGGEHRLEAAKNAGIKRVPCVNLGIIDDVKAKEISLVDNGRYGSDDTLKLAALMDELGGSNILSMFTPYSDADFSSIFSSTSIDLDDLDLDDEDDVPALDTSPSQPATQTHQIMRFKVPIEDVDDVTETMNFIMKIQKLTASDSLTNAGDALVYVSNAYKSMMKKNEDNHV